MLTSILVVLAFLCLGVAGYGFLDALAGGMADGQVGEDATRAGMQLFYGGAGGFALVCAVGIARWLA